jgi:hypothetical protein
MLAALNLTQEGSIDKLAGDPGSLNCSIPSISSWAILAVTIVILNSSDLLPSLRLHYNWCKTIYTKFRVLKVLTCKTPLIYLVSYTLPCMVQKQRSPAVVEH